MSGLGDGMPSFDLAMIEAGEKSGRIDAIFKLLAVHYQERAILMRNMIGELLYPVFVLHIAVLLFPFVHFITSGNALRFLFQAGSLLGTFYLIIFLVLFACQDKRSQWWRSFLEKLLHSMPVLGRARRSLALARLAISLEALVNAGVPIVTGWKMAAASSASPALMRDVARWEEPLHAGQTPSELLSQSREFPDLFANLYHTGEVSGRLDDSLKRIHVFYNDEGSRKMRALSRGFPIAVYLAVAGYVGYTVISFYMGYYNQILQQF